MQVGLLVMPMHSLTSHAGLSPSRSATPSYGTQLGSVYVTRRVLHQGLLEFQRPGSKWVHADIWGLCVLLRDTRVAGQVQGHLLHQSELCWRRAVVSRLDDSDVWADLLVSHHARYAVVPGHIYIDGVMTLCICYGRKGPAH